MFVLVICGFGDIEFIEVVDIIVIVLVIGSFVDVLVFKDWVIWLVRVFLFYDGFEEWSLVGC